MIKYEILYNMIKYEKDGILLKYNVKNLARYRSEN